MSFRIPEDLKRKFKVALAEHELSAQHVLEASIEAFIDGKNPLTVLNILERAKALDRGVNV